MGTVDAFVIPGKVRRMMESLSLADAKDNEQIYRIIDDLIEKNDEFLKKFGGDSIKEIKHNYEGK